MKTAVIQLLQKLNLLKPAYRVQEALKSVNPDTSRRNAEYLKAVSPQELPIPPAKLMVLVAASADAAWFLESGKSSSQLISDLLAKNGIDMEEFDSILDFGCGCGRIIRNWNTLNGVKIYGTDYNPELIDWCRRNLDFAQFGVNALAPPLNYADAQFDFVYAVSVFTHLSEELHRAWMRELSRIVKVGGYLLITTHGHNHAPKLSAEGRKQYDAGRLVVEYEETSGTNLCAAYHPEQYIRQQLAVGYTVVDWKPAIPDDHLHQDLWLLQKNGD